MTNNQTPISQDSSSSLSSLQDPGRRENNETHSPRTMASRKGDSTRSISSSLCVEVDHDESFRSKKDEDEAGDVDSLLKPSDIDFLGIGSQFGDHTR